MGDEKMFLKVDGLLVNAGTEADLVNWANAEGIEDSEIVMSVKLGDKVQLARQVQKVVQCQETQVLMLNIDADQLAPGDLKLIKKLGLTISNPETDKPVALGVDFQEETFGHKLADFFSNDDYEDDSSFFSSIPSSSGSLFGGSSGLGGFGGGSFSGGGATRGF